MTPFYALVPFLGALGFFLFAGGLGLTAVGEQMALNSWRDLTELRETAVTVDPDDPADPAHRLVHVSGVPKPDMALVPPDLDLLAEGVLRVRQTVEMYQWVEVDSEFGNPTYERRWVENRVDSDAFQDRQGHRNPPLPWRSGTVTVPAAHLGSYTLPGGVIERMDWFQPLKVCSEVRGQGAAYTCDEGNFYMGQGSPTAPEVGDVRLALEVVPVEPITLVARQVGAGGQTTLVPWRLSEERQLLLMQRGSHDLEEMIAGQQAEDALAELGIGGLGTLSTGVGAAALLYTVAGLWPTTPGAWIWRHGLFTSTVVTTVGATAVPRTLLWVEDAPLYALATAAIGAASIWLVLFVL